MQKTFNHKKTFIETVNGFFKHERGSESDAIQIPVEV